MEQALAPQREKHHGSRNASRAEEETRQRLSSLIQEKVLIGGTNQRACCWALLAESSRDRLVILDGIDGDCWDEAHNDEFELVAAGRAASWSNPWVSWRGARDLGLPIYYVVGGCAPRLRGPEEQGAVLSDLQPTPTSLSSNSCMLSQVLRPASALSAASPSLLAQGPLDDTAASSSASLDLNSYISSCELAEAQAHVVTRSSGQHSRNGGGGDPAATELLADSDLEARRQAPRVGAQRIGGGATAPIQEPLGLVSVRMDNSAMHPPFGTDMDFSWVLLRILIQRYASGHITFAELAAALLHVVTISSGPRGRNGGGGDPAATEFLVRPLELLTDYDLEAGREAQQVGAWRPGGGAAAPVQEPLDRLQRVLEQVFAAFLPACATTYSLLKDAPDHIKFIIFGGLAFSAVGLFVGMLSNSVARRGLAIRLVSFSAVAVLTFSVAAQLSSTIYIALTALVGVAVNLIIMLLRF